MLPGPSKLSPPTLGLVPTASAACPLCFFLSFFLLKHGWLQRREAVSVAGLPGAGSLGWDLALPGRPRLPVSGDRAPVEGAGGPEAGLQSRAGAGQQHRGLEGGQHQVTAGQDVSPVLDNSRLPLKASASPQLLDPPQTVRCHNWEPRRQALRVERDSEGNRKQKRTSESTIIHWQKTLHTGESFEQNNSTIGIKGNGYYFIYTQVLYQDQTFVMGHVVKRKERGRQKDEETLLRCTQNMPDTQPFNTCYSAGIYRLQRGDIIELVIPRSSANIIMEKDSTFMGLLKVGPI
ncbi:tumor necrosis factor ligand superfamily member 13B-like isoform X2 [Heptranchias perlo]|uniref:tumor necrosis factor ligand superfamily member 13B-like isoform X2 n=1 Tax=Heptranchias perlo TaxID=212740 RepID=UPI00355A6650